MNKLIRRANCSRMKTAQCRGCGREVDGGQNQYHARVLFVWLMRVVPSALKNGTFTGVQHDWKRWATEQKGCLYMHTYRAMSFFLYFILFYFFVFEFDFD